MKVKICWIDYWRSSADFARYRWIQQTQDEPLNVIHLRCEGVACRLPVYCYRYRWTLPSCKLKRVSIDDSFLEEDKEIFWGLIASCSLMYAAIYKAGRNLLKKMSASNWWFCRFLPVWNYLSKWMTQRTTSHSSTYLNQCSGLYQVFGFVRTALSTMPVSYASKW